MQPRLSTAQPRPQIKYKMGAASRVRCLGLQVHLEGASEKMLSPSASAQFLPHPDEMSLAHMLHGPGTAFSPMGSRPRDRSLPSAMVSHHLMSHSTARQRPVHRELTSCHPCPSHTHGLGRCSEQMPCEVFHRGGVSLNQPGPCSPRLSPASRRLDRLQAAAWDVWGRG